MNQAIMKRGMDLVVSGMALLFLLPLLVCIAVVIRLESKGSPLFFQTRVGKGGAPFRIVKFRSMVANASTLGEAWTQANDRRITCVGKFIRNTSLDELPQLWNVLVGEMSLIGPRPMLAADVSLFTPEQWALRHSVRPGITGLAQVNGRSSITLEQQADYDVDYAKHCSIAGDMAILFKTARIVFARAGVN